MVYGDVKGRGSSGMVMVRGQGQLWFNFALAFNMMFSVCSEIHQVLSENAKSWMYWVTD